MGLALALGPDRDGDAAVGQHRHGGRLERPEPPGHAVLRRRRALHEHRHPDADVASVGPGRGLPVPPAVHVEGVDELVEVGTERPEVDAAAGAGDPRSRAVGQQVAPPDLDGVDPEITRDAVEHPLGAEVGLRLAEPAVGADGGGGRGHAAQVEGDRAELVAAGQRPDGHQRRADAREVEDGGADVGGDRGLVGQDAAVVVVADVEVVDLLAGVDAARQRLEPILAPAHGPPGDAGQHRHRALLAGEVLLRSEATAHVGHDHAHVGLAQAAGVGHDGAQLVRLLVRRQQREPPGGGVDGRLGAVPLEGEGGDAVVVDPLGEAVGCGREGGVGGVEPGGQVEEHVGAPLGVQQWCVGADGGEGVHHGRERIDVDVDQLGGVLGHGPGGGDDRGQRFADVAHGAVGEQAPRQGLGGGDRQHVGHRPRPGGGQVGLGHHRHDAGEAEGAGRRDRPDPGVGHRAADERHVAQAGDVVVGQVAAPAGQ